MCESTWLHKCAIECTSRCEQFVDKAVRDTTYANSLNAGWESE